MGEVEHAAVGRVARTEMGKLVRRQDSHGVADDQRDHRVKAAIEHESAACPTQPQRERARVQPVDVRGFDLSRQRAAKQAIELLAKRTRPLEGIVAHGNLEPLPAQPLIQPVDRREPLDRLAEAATKRRHQVQGQASRVEAECPDRRRLVVHARNVLNHYRAASGSAPTRPAGKLAPVRRGTAAAPAATR